jgi:hypothetical protein
MPDSPVYPDPPRKRRWSKPLLCLAVFLIGFIIGLRIPCFTPAPKVGQPAVIVETLDADLQPFAAYWRIETARRFPNAVAVLMHGYANSPLGDWNTHVDGLPALHATQVLVEARKQFPDRTIVLLACNPVHVRLHGFPNTYYSPANVWCIPDKEYNPSGGVGMIQTMAFIPFLVPKRESVNRNVLDPDAVGNIWEFVAAD